MEIVEHSQNLSLVHDHDAHGHGMAHASPQQKAYILKFGWWIYIASEIMFFASFIATFLLAKRLYPDAAEHLNIPLTTANTFLLLTSSYTMVLSLAAIQKGDVKGLQRWLFVTATLGTIFTLVQGYEYAELSHHGVTLSSDMFGSAFYVLTGFHGAHVIIGVVWLFATFYRALNGHFSADNWIGIELLGLYWHFVDVVWVFIFPLAYLIHL